MFEFEFHVISEILERLIIFQKVFFNGSLILFRSLLPLELLFGTHFLPIAHNKLLQVATIGRELGAHPTVAVGLEATRVPVSGYHAQLLLMRQFLPLEPYELVSLYL